MSQEAPPFAERYLTRLAAAAVAVSISVIGPIGCAGPGSRATNAASDRAVTTDTSTTETPAERTLDPEVALTTFDEVWRLVDETHFDPEHLEAIGWDDAHAELRPRAEEATTTNELRRVIGRLLDRLGQSHFALLPQEAVDALDPETSAPAGDREHADDAGEDRDDIGDGPAAGDRSAAAPTDEGRDGSDDGEGTTGIDVRLVDGVVLVTGVKPGSSAAEAGVRAGWIVDTVGGRAVDELLERFPDDLEPRLLGMYAQRLVEARLEGPTGSSVEVVLRDGADEAVGLELERRPASGVVSRLGNLPAIVCETQSRRLDTPEGHEAGYIWFNIWLVPIMGPFSAAVDRFREADGIIVDLRGNPGGIGGMSMSVAGHFIDETVPFGTMTVRGANPLNFVSFPQRVSPSGQRVTPYDGPLAILVDGLTGSTSEIFAGGMQSIDRARIFGQTTMGAALPARMPRLANGDVLLHAFADYVDADGVRLEGRGVVPDEIVEPSREALLDGRDPVLEAALRWIDRSVEWQASETE